MYLLFITRRFTSRQWRSLLRVRRQSEWRARVTWDSGQVLVGESLRGVFGASGFFSGCGKAAHPDIGKSDRLRRAGWRADTSLRGCAGDAIHARQ